jgi:hypothetical protein
MPKMTGPSAYQLQKQHLEQKEYSCGIMHGSLEEAMVHAEQSLGFRDAQGSLVVKLEPLLGGTLFSTGTVIGWQVGSQKRSVLISKRILSPRMRRRHRRRAASTRALRAFT